MSAPLLQTATVLVEVVKALGTGGVLAVLLGSTGLGGAITALMAWKKAPVEKRDADMAAAESAQGMSLALAKDLREEIARLGKTLPEFAPNDITAGIDCARDDHAVSIVDGRGSRISSGDVTPARPGTPDRAGAHGRPDLHPRNQARQRDQPPGSARGRGQRRS